MGIVVGVPKEIKSREYRVGLVPSGVRVLIENGHRVVVESGAGAGIYIADSDYASAGAKIVGSAAEVYKSANMILKVKEPQPNECEMLRKDQLLFTFLHLAPDPVQTELLVKSGCTAVAYETVSTSSGALPLLAPMSEIAGKVAAQAGARALEKSCGGRGLLLGGVPGVEAGRACVIGGGVVGTNAAKVLSGMGAKVRILDNNVARLRELDAMFNGLFETVFCNNSNLERILAESDIVVGAVLIPGGAAPKVVTRNMLKVMKKGSVIVDVAIDQGGCFETSHPTTHDDPLYEVDGVIHYCVSNMPGAVPLTSTYALTNVTLPFAVKLASTDILDLISDPMILSGVNIYKGKVTCKGVASALGYDFYDLSAV